MPRVVACLAGVALFSFACWSVLLVLLSGAISAQRPDPTVPDGDPCCPYPDTWSEVGLGSVFTLGLSAILGGLFAFALALTMRAFRDRWPPLRSLVIGPLAAVALTTLAVGVALLVPP